MELRGEVTRLRLYNEMEAVSSGEVSLIPESVPESARKFYNILPQPSDRSIFFRWPLTWASAWRIARIMGIFLRERMLIRHQKDNFEKADLLQFELPLS